MNSATQSPSSSMLGPLMLDLEGSRLTREEQALLDDPRVGGVILFARNYQSREQLRALVEEIRRVRPELLLAVDQEGGRVQRFQTDFTRLPPMHRFLSGYRADPQASLSLVRDAGWLMAAELIAADIDFSFAPVLDVDRDYSTVIGDRAFSDRAEEVVQLAGAFMAGMQEAGMATTGKHFPGHGGVQGDSHVLLPVDERSWDEIVTRDWQPFRTLAGTLDAVMPAHIVFKQFDSQPVGFSRYWLQDRLRGELGFQGVIFSDDLSMEGAAGAGSYGNRAELALAAGCDMVLVCNNRPGALEVIDHLKQSPARASPRLSAMRKRRGWELADLQSRSRWQDTRVRLEKLLPQSP